MTKTRKKPPAPSISIAGVRVIPAAIAGVPSNAARQVSSGSA